MLIEMARLSRDQKRKQKLAERHRRHEDLAQRRPVVTLTDTIKNRIAEAVHAAVCNLSGDDGFGRCAYYAVAGAVLVSAITGSRYLPQAGSLYLCGDPAEPTLYTAMVAEDGIESGEFHCWCVGPAKEGRKSGPATPDLEFIDFSARHFKGLVNKLCKMEDRQRLPGGGFFTVFSPPKNNWRRSDPPNYLWSNRAGLPKWIIYDGDNAATETLFNNLAEFEPVVRLAGRLFGKTR